MCIRTDIQTHMQSNTNTCIDMQTCKHANMQTCKHSNMITHKYAYIHTGTHAYQFTYIHAYVHTCIHVHTKRTPNERALKNTLRKWRVRLVVSGHAPAARLRALANHPALSTTHPHTHACTHICTQANMPTHVYTKWGDLTNIISCNHGSYVLRLPCS